MKKVLPILVFTLYSCFVFGQMSWQWQSPLPQGNTLNSVFFIDDNTGWTVGMKGTILKTSDGGNTWDFQLYGLNMDLNKVYFINALTGFALSDTSRMLTTTNGGANWVFKFIGGNSLLRGMLFLNQTTGFMCGVSFSENMGVIYKTTNTGLNWDLKQIALPTYLRFTTIQQISTNLLFLGGGNASLFQSIDTGKTWLQRNFYNVLDFNFIDSLNGIASYYSGYIIKTTNGGYNYSISYTMPNLICNSVKMVDDSTAYCFGYNGVILKTTNFGGNWVIQNSGTTLELFSSYFFDSVNIITVGEGGIILKTSNGGVNWNNVSPGSRINYTSASFINEYTGYVSGDWTVKKTTNGGVNWVEKWDSAGNRVNLLCFIDANTGWGAPQIVSGELVSIYKTTNGSDNWFHIGTIIKHTGWFVLQIHLFSISFINSNTGWACGTYQWYIPQYGNGFDGILCKTTDGGLNWVNFGFPSSHAYDIKFVDINTGWAVGANKIIQKTTNGGLNWMTQTCPDSLTNKKIAIINQDVVFILSIKKNLQDIYLVKTTNGGTNWVAIPVSNKIGITGISFINENVGWLSGEKGHILVTTDGGYTWLNQISPTNNNLSNIVFVNGNTGWATGANGTILKTTAGIVSGIVKQTESTPTGFKLHQNYPNPFNPSTVVRFEVQKLESRSQNSEVTLKIFDVLGREVETLVNERLQPGSYEVTFDGSRLTSGVYFYRLMTGDFSETKKMLLIK